tara:strand:+ start:4277 stop:4807 length:531 start_codon:yes stop_codon:yes gene_type:complete
MKNNLKNMRTYLVGAMDRVDDGGVGWRKAITPMLLEMDVQVLNPCEKPIESSKETPDTRAIIDYYKKTGQFDKIRNEYGHIRNADLRCVDISDFVIANINMNVHMCGSYEEIATANRQKKPVLVWCEQGKMLAPNWLFFMLPHEHIFSSMDGLLAYLYDVSISKDRSKLKRWFFLE